MLTLEEPGDGWLTFREARGGDPAVRVRLAPFEPWMKRRAGQLSNRERSAEEMTLSAADLPIDRVLDFGEVYTRELLRLAIVEWEGVGDKAGKPAEVTPPFEVRKLTYADPERPKGTVDQFLALPEMVAAGDRLYVLPLIERDRPKNGSPASPSGTGEAGTEAPITARSAAGTVAGAGAKSAPTSPKSPPRRKKSSSGTSSGAASGSSASPA